MAQLSPQTCRRDADTIHSSGGEEGGGRRGKGKSEVSSGHLS